MIRQDRCTAPSTLGVLLLGTSRKPSCCVLWRCWCLRDSYLLFLLYLTVAFARGALSSVLARRIRVSIRLVPRHPSTSLYNTRCTTRRHTGIQNIVLQWAIAMIRGTCIKLITAVSLTWSIWRRLVSRRVKTFLTFQVLITYVSLSSCIGWMCQRYNEKHTPYWHLT